LENEEYALEGVFDLNPPYVDELLTKTSSILIQKLIKA
jgi:hypothetical protein